jgi:hypothetical protein
MIRPGVTSRRAASSSRASQSALTAPSPRRPRMRCSPTYGARPRPSGRARRRAGTGTPGGPTRSCRPRASGPGGPRAARSAPRRRGRRTPATARAAAVGPVDGGVLLLHAAAEHRSPPRWPGRRAGTRAGGPASSVTKSEPGRRPTSARQGRSWEAACRIQSVPCRAAAKGGQRLEGDGVDQPGPGALPAELDEVGPAGVAVAEARSASIATGPLPAAIASQAAASPASVSINGREPVAQGEEGESAALGCVGARGLGVFRRCGFSHQAPEPRCPPSARDDGHAVGHRWQPDRGAEELPPGLDVRSDVEALVSRAGRHRGRPRSPDLELRGGTLLGHPPEALRRHARHRPRRHVVRRAVCVERVGRGQAPPDPAASGRVIRLDVDLGPCVGRTHRNSPSHASFPIGSWQQDDPAGAPDLPRRHGPRRPTERRAANGAIRCGGRASPRSGSPGPQPGRAHGSHGPARTRAAPGSRTPGLPGASPGRTDHVPHSRSGGRIRDVRTRRTGLGCAGL